MEMSFEKVHGSALYSNLSRNGPEGYIGQWNHRSLRKEAKPDTGIRKGHQA